MLTRVRLELARTHDFPNGARDIGYSFTVPLTPAGKIDTAAFLQSKQKCIVHRFRPKEDDDIGHLIRKPGGSWAFHYDIHTDQEDDESGYRFGDHIFKTGEYVSIKEDDVLNTYVVAMVQTLD